MVERSRLFGVHDVTLVEEVVVPELQSPIYQVQNRPPISPLFITTHFVAEEASGDVDFLTPDDDDFLAGEDLLRDDRGQSTKEVALAIDDDGRRRESGHGGCL